MIKNQMISLKFDHFNVVLYSIYWKYNLFFQVDIVFYEELKETPIKIVVKLLKKYHMEVDKGRILCLQQNKSGKKYLYYTLCLTRIIKEIKSKYWFK